jgi:hypothetical protein
MTTPNPNRRTAHAAPSLLLLALLGALTSACATGVPIESRPQPVAVPGQLTPNPTLFRPPPSTQPNPTRCPKTSKKTSKACPTYFDIYLVATGQRGQVLVAVDRISIGKPTPQAALTALDAGPTRREGGLQTALPSGALPTVSKLVGHEVTVGISVGALSPIAIGQIVLTVTAPSFGITRVLFEQAGVQVEPPLPNGGYATGYVSRGEYGALGGA